MVPNLDHGVLVWLAKGPACAATCLEGRDTCVVSTRVTFPRHWELTLASEVTLLVACRCLELLKGFEKLRWTVACSLADAKVPEADEDCVSTCLRFSAVCSARVGPPGSQVLDVGS